MTEEPEMFIKATLTKKITPKWRSDNLADHVKKRNSVDAECVENVFGFERGKLLGKHLRKRSVRAFKDARLVAEYEKEKARGSGKFGFFRPLRAQFIDGELMTAITDSSRKTFITCFHYHIDPLFCQGIPKKKAEAGRDLLKVVRRLKDGETREAIRNLKIIKS